ncbi:MAG: hypothetical protein CK552_03735 [Actinobacteria bacterium]|nr:MAG: hypothetical protein CK552_03735 [Actinomycetota bacterium]
MSRSEVSRICAALDSEVAAGNDEGNAWAPYLRGLVERGLAGVRLVISDAHRGLGKAVRETLLGAAWQRCRVHFTRNAQALVPRSAAGMVASAIRSIFEQPDEHAASEQLRRVADGRAPRNAARLAHAPRVEGTTRRRTLTPAEARALLGLDWSDVDLAAGTVSIARSRSRNGTGPTKSANGGSPTRSKSARLPLVSFG